MKRAKLLAVQAAMRDKAAGNPTDPVVFVSGLAAQVVAILKSVGTRPKVNAALADGLIEVIAQLRAVVIDPTTTAELKEKAMNSLMWLFSVCMRQERVLATAAANRETAKKARTKLEVERERQKRAVAEIPLIISRKRQAIQKKLDQALKG